FRFSIKAYPRSSDQFNCYICGLEDHVEISCPYNYIFGRFDSRSCRGECPPGSGQHRITSLAHGRFLRHFVRVSNLPSGFTLLDFQELFGPFGPMPMWDVPMFRNYKCCCISEIRMRFGVVVFKNRSDGERAINYLNGYEAGGCKLRVDWAYPSVV
ncbi:hypothetical protein PVAP13_2NG426303, partial [Panicum virgatum]